MVDCDVSTDGLMCTQPLYGGDIYIRVLALLTLYFLSFRTLVINFNFMVLTCIYNILFLRFIKKKCRYIT